MRPGQQTSGWQDWPDGQVSAGAYSGWQVEVTVVAEVVVVVNVRNVVVLAIACGETLPLLHLEFFQYTACGTFAMWERRIDPAREDLRIISRIVACLPALLTCRAIGQYRAETSAKAAVLRRTVLDAAALLWWLRRAVGRIGAEGAVLASILLGRVAGIAAAEEALAIADWAKKAVVVAGCRGDQMMSN